MCIRDRGHLLPCLLVKNVNCIAVLCKAALDPDLLFALLVNQDPAVGALIPRLVKVAILCILPALCRLVEPIQHSLYEFDESRLSSFVGSLHEIQALLEFKGGIAEPAESLNMYCLNPHMAASYRFFISCKSASNPWYSASWAYGSWRSIFSSIVSMKRPMMEPAYSFFRLSRS